MPGDAAATKRKILGTSYELFYQKGYYRVSMDEVATATGVTERTLYYHFKSKDELLSAVMEFHQSLALERIRKWGDRLSGSPQQAVEALFADLNRGVIETAMEWQWLYAAGDCKLADMPGHPAQRSPAVIKRRSKRGLPELLKGLGARKPAELARQVQLLIEGATSLASIHGDRAYVAAAAKAARELVTASGTV